MNYYIQGSAARAEEIKAAFEKMGFVCTLLDCVFDNEKLIFLTSSGVVYSFYIYQPIYDIIKTHPDYKELELPVEPKFKVEDWITDGTCKVKITAISNTYYWYAKNCILGEIESIDKKYHLWSIQDAKDGDVLSTDNGWTCIFKAFDGCVFSSYCFMDSQKWFCVVSSEAHTPDSRINGNILPATKEQRDLLFKKMKEAGYQWDADKKELKKIQHYDITNFKPFDKVLVRDSDGEKWRCNWFSHYSSDGGVYRFVTTKCGYAQCIPFEGNETLLGTTDMCDEQFINW